MKFSEFASKHNISLVCFADPANKVDGKTPFKYKVNLVNGNKVFTTDYIMGPGNVGFRKAGKVERAYLHFPLTERECNRLSPVLPEETDVLSCLQLDCSSYTNAMTWEDFASEFGYNVDSIKEKKVFKACRKSHAKLVKFLGQAAFNEFMECTEE